MLLQLRWEINIILGTDLKGLFQSFMVKHYWEGFIDISVWAKLSVAQTSLL